MYQDADRHEVYRHLGEQDLRVFAGMLRFEVFVEAAQRAGVRIASSPLNVVTLVWLGLSAAWRKSASFVTILTATLKLLQDQQSFPSSAFARDLRKKTRRAPKRTKASKHDPHGTDLGRVSEEAFAKARQPVAPSCTKNPTCFQAPRPVGGFPFLDIGAGRRYFQG